MIRQSLHLRIQGSYSVLFAQHTLRVIRLEMVVTLDSDVAFALFVVLFVTRYLRTVVSIFTWNLYTPKPISEKPKYRSEDVTVIVPTTYQSPGELVQCLKSSMRCSPAAVLIVTSYAKLEVVKTCCAINFSGKTVRVLGVQKLNKRRQMLKALEEVKTSTTVFADDDVFWPVEYLDYLLAIFENPDVGAGGTRQRVRRNKEKINFWNFLGICYLERRVWNNVTTQAIDGSISTLSGRTAAYRTEILQTEEFLEYLVSDSWLGKKLNSDDDKALTRYVYSHGWDIAMQFDGRAIVETTLHDNSKYLSQCMRWGRAHWRGNFTVMTNEAYWLSSRYWWGAYVIYFGQFQTPAFLVDGILISLLISGLRELPVYRTLGAILLGSWILGTKVLKLIPHFRCHPEDLKFIPIAILFSYLHGIINVHALLTLYVTAWGGRNLDELKSAWAHNEDTEPLLRDARDEVEQFRE